LLNNTNSGALQLLAVILTLCGIVRQLYE